MTNNNTYLDRLNETISDHKKLLDALEKKQNLLLRLVESRNEDNSKGVLEQGLDRINYEIELLKIPSEIHTLKKVILEKEKYFEKYAAEYEGKLKEMEANYNKVYAMAQNSAKSNPAIEKFLRSADMNVVNSAVEYKVNFYFELKKLLKK